MAPKPVIAIIGTTGVGKTKLSLALASRFKTEIINVDAMQMYRGFDIITNKATPEERRSAPHHLIDFVEIDQEYQVQDFERDALCKIEGLHAQGKIPILVGGTHYYVQSLLWKASLINLKPEAESNDEAASLLAKENIEELHRHWEGLSNKDLLHELEKVDPKMAEHWHVNDRRKILRGLAVFYETGKPQSSWILERAKTPGEGKELRFDTIFLWLYANKAQLDARLDTRVDKMVEQGLFEELEMFQKLRSSLPGEEEQYDRGLKQAIGFKAFDAYFHAIRDGQSSEIIKKLRAEGLETMKQQTRKYAKKQVGWIRNQLLPLYFCSPQFPSNKDALPAAGPLAKLYLLDATDLAAWADHIQERAFALVDEILRTRRGPDPTSLSGAAAEFLTPPSTLKTEPVIATWVKRLCEECSRRIDKKTRQLVEPVVINGERAWEEHLKSKGHRRQVQFNRHKALTLVSPQPDPARSTPVDIESSPADEPNQCQRARESGKQNPWRLCALM